MRETRKLILFLFLSFAIYSCTATVFGRGASAAPQQHRTQKPDEYGDVCWKREKEILRNFAIRLKNEARTNGYLIVYAGRRTPNLEEANNRGRRAKEHLIKLGVARERVVFIDGGFREQLTWEVWVVPEGAPPPVPTPTVEPYEVEIIAAPEKKPCPESSSIQK